MTVASIVIIWYLSGILLFVICGILDYIDGKAITVESLIMMFIVGFLGPTVFVMVALFGLIKLVTLYGDKVVFQRKVDR